MTTWRAIGLRTLMVVIGVSCQAGGARAQSMHKAELSGAYQFVFDSSLAESGMRRDSGAQGWNLDAAFPLTRRMSLVASVDGSRGRDSQEVFDGGTLVSSWTDLVYLGGVRFHPASPARVVPFAQILAGALRSNQTDEYQNAQPLGTYRSSEDVFLVSIGGGLNVMMTPRFGLRFGADIRIDPVGAALQGDDTAMGRAVAGIVLALP